MCGNRTVRRCEGVITVTAMTLCARPGFGFATRFTALDDDARARLARELDRLRQKAARA